MNNLAKRLLVTAAMTTAMTTAPLIAIAYGQTTSYPTTMSNPNTMSYPTTMSNPNTMSYPTTMSDPNTMSYPTTMGDSPELTPEELAAAISMGSSLTQQLAMANAAANETNTTDGSAAAAAAAAPVIVASCADGHGWEHDDTTPNKGTCAISMRMGKAPNFKYTAITFANVKSAACDAAWGAVTPKC
jgi:hypothetical protein